MNRIPRSLLFVPATGSKMANAQRFDADAVIFDLEDSVKAENKSTAAENLVWFLSEHLFADRQVFVRVNAERLEEEIRQMDELGERVNGFMIPKFETAEVLKGIDLKGRQIIALIETPKGLLDLCSIVSDNRVDAAAFGAEDYCSIAGTANEEAYLLPIKTEIVKCCRAYGKCCFDTISKELTASRKLEEEVTASRKIGFDGKLAIHPVQIPMIHAAFMTPEKNRIKEIIDAFERCEEGVLVYEGTVYERPHIERLKKEMEK